MKELLLIGMLCMAVSGAMANENPSDTTDLMFEDSLMSNIDIDDSVDINFDANLDSMMNMYEVEQQPSINAPGTFTETSEVPDFPDSVYIQRISSIPTVVNLSYNHIVKRYIDVYTKKKRQSVEVMLGLSQHYFPIFDDIFDSYDVPNEMKYMSVIESALNPRAYSRARAVGLWQFMYGTGRLYGLEVNSIVDERLDPIKSTYAAAKFVSDLYDVYKDWILVIAAYNCGPGNVNKAIRRSGGKRNYWDIYYYLPRETRGHVPAFIAATYVMNFYKEHNLVPAAVDMPLACDTLHIHQQLHLQQVSEVIGVPLQQLRDLNPQYRCDIIPANNNKTYTLRIPIDYTLSFIDYQNTIYSYKDSIFFDPAKLVVSPSSKQHVYFIPEAPGADYKKLVYIVKSGDNLGFVSSWYDVNISDLRYWNGIHRNVIRSGQKLLIYKHKNKADRYKDIDKMTLEQKQAMIGKPMASVQTTQIQDPNYKGEYIMYTVKSGDSLWDIAKKFPGVSDNDIMQLNNIKNVSMIKPGQQLKIKPKI